MRQNGPFEFPIHGNWEYYQYDSYDEFNKIGRGFVRENHRTKFIRFVDGKVESFGTQGDFDSTKDPTSKVVIDQKVSIDKREEVVGGKSSPASFDLKTELEKLDNLKKNGLISDAEFKEIRQRAIDKAKAQ